MEEKEKSQMLKEKPRGTQDELEVLKLIIEAHPGLKTRVLNKIREMRKSGDSGGRLRVEDKKAS